MGAPDLLQHLRDCGLQLEVDGDMLTVKPRNRLTDELRQAIREFKPALLALLAGSGRATGRNTAATSKAAYWPHTQHANDTELEAMEARLIHFKRRGMTDTEADQLADKLLQADRLQTGQVTCHLCHHFSPARKTCGNFRLSGTGRDLGELSAHLQRCPGYKGLQ